MYFKRLLLLCALPFIVFASDLFSDTQFLALKINDLDSFIGVISQKIETAQKLKDFSQMSYLQHAYNEAQANKEAAKALKQFLDGEIQLNGTQVISRLRTEEKFIRDADILLDSLVENGGKTPKGNKVLNSSIREVLGVDKIPVDLTIRDARRIRQDLHGNLAIKQRTAEALEYAHASQHLTEGAAIRYIDRRISSLANKTPNNPFYDDMVKFIIGAKPPIPLKTLDFSQEPLGVKHFLQVDTTPGFLQNNGFPNDDAVLNKIASNKSGSPLVPRLLGDSVKGARPIPLPLDATPYNPKTDPSFNQKKVIVIGLNSKSSPQALAFKGSAAKSGMGSGMIRGITGLPFPTDLVRYVMYETGLVERPLHDLSFDEIDHKIEALKLQIGILQSRSFLDKHTIQAISDLRKELKNLQDAREYKDRLQEAASGVI